MNYTFKTTDNIELSWGTSKILNIADGFSSEEEVKIRGQILTLFGEPLQTSPDLEAAYNYVIIATNENGEETLLTLYGGPTGAAIGGKFLHDYETAEEYEQNNQKNLKIAQVLKDYVKQAEASDFEYVGEYEGMLKIVQKIENGVISYSETPI